MLDSEWAVAWVKAAAASVAEHKMELIELDRVIGDGDHGENLDRGFQAVLAKLETNFETPGEVFKLLAMTLMSVVGGAAGPLYGTAFLRAATAAGEASALNSDQLATVLAAARDGIVARGKAEPGDKTMVDAWTPAVEAADEAVENGLSPEEVLTAAAAAAEQGATDTEPLQARKGRASYLGERSIGHRDPGAQSTALILRCAASTARDAA
ncbi:dihydroxyacetone kinase-like protein [Psychromicrobium silvestre]|uniref:Dihydroxyacetone kinase-like protein n=1 Tax=Psychromicrobium silvestre TaxID=1645614 RepID=A0A7Y9S7I7_9MICC|nr:dihydroxyacetone kinase subunit DhaL [Psychromicrobium silvestre]NYE96078.1 dihydroxyacetone kinase-like protein [Psychromicrobium silvestre]